MKRLLKNLTGIAFNDDRLRHPGIRDAMVSDLPYDRIVYISTDETFAERILTHGIEADTLQNEPLIAFLDAEQAVTTGNDILIAIDCLRCPRFGQWTIDERQPDRLAILSDIPAAALSIHEIPSLRM